MEGEINNYRYSIESNKELNSESASVLAGSAPLPLESAPLSFAKQINVFPDVDQVEKLVIGQLTTFKDFSYLIFHSKLRQFGLSETTIYSIVRTFKDCFGQYCFNHPIEEGTPLRLIENYYEKLEESSKKSKSRWVSENYCKFLMISINNPLDNLGMCLYLLIDFMIDQKLNKANVFSYVLLHNTLIELIKFKSLRKIFQKKIIYSDLEEIMNRVNLVVKEKLPMTDIEGFLQDQVLSLKITQKNPFVSSVPSPVPDTSSPGLSELSALTQPKREIIITNDNSLDDLLELAYIKLNKNRSLDLNCSTLSVMKQSFGSIRMLEDLLTKTRLSDISYDFLRDRTPKAKGAKKSGFTVACYLLVIFMYQHGFHQFGSKLFYVLKNYVLSKFSINHITHNHFYSLFEKELFEIQELEISDAGSLKKDFKLKLTFDN